MRTTVTLDPAVERLVRLAMSSTGRSFKQVLNDALRRGLADIEAQAGEQRFVVEARPMQLRAGLDPARLNALAGELEMDAHVGLTQRLRTRS